MALIFSPLTEDILEGPFEPYPRGAFVMLQDNKGTPEIDIEIDQIVCDALKNRDFQPLKATTKRGTKDFLEKIIQMIRGCGFGIAIFSEYTAPTSLANIFFEVGLCNMLGKPVVIVKNKGADAPSDFVRTEWVTYVDDQAKLEKDFKKSLFALEELAIYFEKLGDLAYGAEEKDLELAFERFKQAVLIRNIKSAKEKIKKVLESVEAQKNIAGLEASRKRLRTAMAEFYQFIS